MSENNPLDSSDENLSDMFKRFDNERKERRVSQIMARYDREEEAYLEEMALKQEGLFDWDWREALD